MLGALRGWQWDTKHRQRPPPRSSPRAERNRCEHSAPKYFSIQQSCEVPGSGREPTLPKLGVKMSLIHFNSSKFLWEQSWGLGLRVGGTFPFSRCPPAHGPRSELLSAPGRRCRAGAAPFCRSLFCIRSDLSGNSALITLYEIVGLVLWLPLMGRAGSVLIGPLLEAAEAGGIKTSNILPLIYRI